MHSVSLAALTDDAAGSERAEPLKSTSVALSARQLGWLETRALREGLRRSDIIRRAIEVYIRLEERPA